MALFVISFAEIEVVLSVALAVSLGMCAGGGVAGLVLELQSASLLHEIILTIRQRVWQHVIAHQNWDDVLDDWLALSLE